MYKKKSLSQHFLRSKVALAKIVEAARLSPDDTVFEIGPGEGALTELLLQKTGRVVAVEKDDRLMPVLKAKFAKEIASGKFELVHADILNYELGIMPARLYRSGGNYESRYKVVANIPYYITGALIRRFLESDIRPSMMVLLLQKEVVKRIVASDGRESILSISVKVYGTPKYIGTVKAGAFSPPPKVDSAIIAIENISKDVFDTLACHLRENDIERRFFVLLKKGFAHPRKLLSSNLCITAEQLRACGIAEKARAENLSLENWKCLFTICIL